MMRLTLSTFISALLAGTAFVSAGGHNARYNKRHHELAAREPKPAPGLIDGRSEVEANATEHSIDKRGGSDRFTFYDVGLGACGITNVPSDFIVALNSDQYGGGYPGPQCFKMITISANGKTTSAQITDECPGCPYGGLDMSTGLFTFFADESVGVLYGSWSFSDGSGSGGSSSSSSTWTPTSSKWTPTSTWVPPTTSSQWTPTTTWSSTEEKTTWSSSSSTWSSSSIWSSSSTSTHWSSSSSSWSSSSWSSSDVVPTSSYDLSSGAASGLAVATGSGALPSPTDAYQNIYNMNIALIDMGAVINAGAAH